ncbi:MAG: HEAT repeat protein, partial [Planctomycetota bacterium]
MMSTNSLHSISGAATGRSLRSRGTSTSLAMGLFVTAFGLALAQPLPAMCSASSAVVSSKAETQAVVWQILEKAAKGPGSDADIDELGKSIHDLGGSALLVVAGALCGGILEPQGDPNNDEQPQVLDPKSVRLQQRILNAALGYWPVEDQLEALVHQCRSEHFDHKIQALRLIGEVGGAPAIPSLFEVLAGVDSLQFRNSQLQAHTIAALARALDSDAKGYGALEEQLAGARLEVLRLTVSALGKTGSSRAIPVLMDLVGVYTELDLDAIQTLGELSEMSTENLPEGLADLLRAELYSRDTKMVRVAAVGLSRMNDLESIPLFLPMLESEDRALASTVQWCLAHMSGKDFPADQASWTAWYDAESTWYANDSSTLYEALQSEDLAQVGGALIQLGAHRLYR